MQKKINLFEEIRSNIDTINVEYNKIKNSNCLEDFAKCINEKSNVSINRSASAILEFLEYDVLLTGPECAKKQSISFKKFLENNPDWREPYISRRIEFFESFINGEKHFFGALNLGCAGAAARKGAYGYYCIIIKNELLENNPNVAYCKFDTLGKDDYWDTNNKLNFKNLLDDYSPHSHRGQLASIKHKNDINCNQKEVDWMKTIIKARKVLGNDNEWDTEEYIEACFIADIKKNNIKEIRFHRRLVILFFEELLEPYRHPSDFEKHNEIEKKLKNINIDRKWDNE